MTKLFQCLGAAIILVVPSYTYANFGVSVSVGTSNYEFQVTEADFSDTITDRFLYRDVGVDYTNGSHQFGLKLGGLGSQSGSVELQGGSNPLVQNSGAERSDWLISYSYRTKIGVGLSIGYYSSEISSDRGFTYATEVPVEINGIPAGTSSADVIQTTKKIVDNDGFFIGAAYSKPFSEKLGGFVRVGYQWSNASEATDDLLTITPTAAGATQYSDAFQRDADVDGTATVFGLGVYFGITNKSTGSIFYEIKDFSFDGSVYQPNNAAISVSEKQPIFGAQFRYAF